MLVHVDGFAVEEVENRALADGQDQRVDIDLEFRAGHGFRNAAARVVPVVRELHAPAAQAAEFTVLDD